MQSSENIFSISYFGPVQQYSKIIQSESIYFEQFENFVKQTYRNRCTIYGANGILTLSIPVIGGRLHKIPIREAKIDYSENWQHIHLQSIISAYRSTPYFEHYIDDMEQLYKAKTELLWNFCFESMKIALNWLEVKKDVKLTSDFIGLNKVENDFRYNISPKVDFRTDNNFNISEYYQVFSDKHGFIPNLSILDLIFHEGPNALEYLENCHQ